MEQFQVWKHDSLYIWTSNICLCNVTWHLILLALVNMKSGYLQFWRTLSYNLWLVCRFSSLFFDLWMVFAMRFSHISFYLIQSCFLITWKLKLTLRMIKTSNTWDQKKKNFKYLLYLLGVLIFACVPKNVQVQHQFVPGCQRNWVHVCDFKSVDDIHPTRGPA